MKKLALRMIRLALTDVIGSDLLNAVSAHDYLFSKSYFPCSYTFCLDVAFDNETWVNPELLLDYIDIIGRGYD